MLFAAPHNAVRYVSPTATEPPCQQWQQFLFLDQSLTHLHENVSWLSRCCCCCCCCPFLLFLRLSEYLAFAAAAGYSAIHQDSKGKQVTSVAETEADTAQLARQRLRLQQQLLHAEALRIGFTLSNCSVETGSANPWLMVLKAACMHSP